MLVLSRKPGEQICIGDVVVTCLKLRGQTAEIGIEAPADVRIMRTELLEIPAGPTGANEQPAAAKLPTVA